jgi:hypothetical protein
LLIPTASFNEGIRLKSLLKQIVRSALFNNSILSGMKKSWLAFLAIDSEQIKWIPSTYSSRMTPFSDGPLIDQNLKHLTSLASSPSSTNKANFNSS